MSRRFPVMGWSEETPIPTAIGETIGADDVVPRKRLVVTGPPEAEGES